MSDQAKVRQAIEEAAMVAWLKFKREVLAGGLPGDEEDVQNTFIGAFANGAVWGAVNLASRKTK